MKVADLFALFAVKVDGGSVNRAQSAIGRIGNRLLGLGATLGTAGLVGAMISFNAEAEQAKNQVAGMLSLAKKTDLTDELANADMLYTNLRKRAADLPGTTQEYVKMLGAITQPVVGAGLSLKQLEDMTVNAVIASKALGITWQSGARDVEQAIRGQLNVRDQLTIRLLKNMGIETQADRQRFNAMTTRQRAEMVHNALMQKQVTQLGDAYAKSFTGQKEQAQDAIMQTLGKVGEGLFAGLKSAMASFNAWFKENRETIMKWAEVVGQAIGAVFEGIMAALEFLSQDTDAVIAALTGVGGVIMVILAPFILMAAKLMLVAAAIALVTYGVIKLIRWFRQFDSFGDFWDYLMDKGAEFGDWLMTLPEKVIEVGAAIGNAIADGIKSAVGAAIDWILDRFYGLMDDVVDNPVTRAVGIDTDFFKKKMSDYKAPAAMDEPVTAGSWQNINAAPTANVQRSPLDIATGMGALGQDGGGSVAITQHIHPAPGMSEREVGDLAAARIAEDIRKLRSGQRGSVS